MPASKRDPRYSRQHPDAGWTSGKRRPCRNCGKEPPAARRTFCSDACVHDWKIRSSPSYCAELVLKRDRGVCASCGLDCVKLLDELWELLRKSRSRHAAAGNFVSGNLRPYDRPISFELSADTPFAARVRELGLTGSRASLERRLWEMDHVVPVVEGGGSCGLDNYRTLCWACHNRETAALRKRLAAAKKRS